MSTKGSLTREQAVALVGEEAVAKVEREYCDCTNRVMDDGLVEFAASIKVGDNTLRAYYYQTQAAVDAAAELDELDWEIEGFEFV